MPQTRTSCPRCRQPVLADVEQVFDVNVDPQAKQRFLSGAFNIINCPHCGYQGSLATPIVYHDPNKELMLTYFPPELGLPLNEQERLIGPMLNQIVNKLPNEKRKAYLLRPQTVLTLQGMMERVLEADGITRDMIQAQQQRLNLVQRLLSAPRESRLEIIKAEAALIDESFFSLLNRLIEAALSGGDEQAAREMAEIQNLLLKETEVGKKLHGQAQEAQEAMKVLQEASQKGLTREGLLELILSAPSETRLVTLVSMARGGMDYAFFQILGERIDQTSDPEERARLEALRDRLLQLTSEIDQEVKTQSDQIHQLLEEILKAEDIEQATIQALPAVTQLFVDILNGEIQQARQKGDLDRSSKLQKIVAVLQKASAPPPEYQLLEELIAAEDDAGRKQILQENSDQVTPEFLDLVSNLVAQTHSQNQDPELSKQMEAVHRSVLRYSMETNMKK